jgi:hypothetical protein
MGGIEMGTFAMIYVPSFTEIRSGVGTLKGKGGYTESMMIE